MNAVVLRAFGGPEELHVERLPVPVVVAGQRLIDVTFAGINFDDLERRRGDHEQALPAVLGVDVVGRRRTDGRRVAALLRNGGGYAQVAAATEAHTVELPEHVDDQQAAALLEQGSTAYGSLVLAGRLARGEVVAVAAAAGGVGHLAVQIAVALGAGRVIGIASSADKRQLVAELGADVVLETGANLGERLRDATRGHGVDVFVDSVGGPHALDALDGLAPFGRLVCLGWRDNGEIRVGTGALIDRSVGFVGFWMRHVVDDRPLLDRVTGEVFGLAARGRLVAHIDRVVGLAGVGAAHAAMAARATAGKVLIDVNRE